MSGNEPTSGSISPGVIRASSTGPKASPSRTLESGFSALGISISISISIDRLMARIDALHEISPLEGGGNSRLAFTDHDKAGRDLVVAWMRDLGLEVTIDGIGNVVGVQPGFDVSPVMMGSHIDTVATGGRFDGNLGVLSGLEVIEAVIESGEQLTRPLAVGFFSNEEGARFAPDMMGSLVYVGGMGVEEALDTIGIDGKRVGDELEQIGYLGGAPVPGTSPHAFVELHVEQGPVLEEEGVTIGAVESVQGISWTEIVIEGQSNHAGTTPIRLRHDPAYVAGEISVFVRNLALRFGGDQVATVGRIDLHPNLVNVVPATATLTVDLRNTDEGFLAQAEAELRARLVELANTEGVAISANVLARFEPVVFDPRIVDLVERAAKRNGHSVKRMPSGAGHDAQMFARVCPTAMVFVPSVEGVSHNPAEFTSVDDLAAGAQVLLDTVLSLAGGYPSQEAHASEPPHE
ncbi:MAG: M20 family metallo-hydrolase [Actinomycetia bacterium]|nr:M20 family metallo-hydrolase [Actinomycetes bacterium]